MSEEQARRERVTNAEPSVESFERQILRLRAERDALAARVSFLEGLLQEVDGAQQVIQLAAEYSNVILPNDLLTRIRAALELPA